MKTPIELKICYIAIAFLGVTGLASLAQLIPMTQAEKDLSTIDRNIAVNIMSLKSYVATLNQTYASVWGLSDARLEAALEKAGQSNVTQLIALHSNAATGANTLLAAVGVTNVQALVAPNRTLTWSGTNVTITPTNAP